MSSSKKSINNMSLEELQKQKEEMIKQQKEIANMIRLRQKEEEKERIRLEREAEIAKAFRFMEWGKTILFNDGTNALETFERIEATSVNENNLQGTSAEDISSTMPSDQDGYSEENDATNAV